MPYNGVQSQAHFTMREHERHPLFYSAWIRFQAHSRLDWYFTSSIKYPGNRRHKIYTFTLPTRLSSMSRSLKSKNEGNGRRISSAHETRRILDYCFASLKRSPEQRFAGRSPEN